MSDVCPSESEILDFVEGRLTTSGSNRVRAHVDACDACRELVATVADDVLRSGDDPDPADADPWMRGTVIGRYTVLERVGAGGMGAVYAAYDPRLDRKVALKLLRTDVLQRGDPDELRARLGAEAQAMARLNHPHVVAVYDVGTFGDELFIAMEFVDGVTLRAWTRERPRTWREILDRFLLAGEGLLAAHRVGLVHRDFKPENVLVAADGGVRVSDFGLARSGTSASASSPTSASPAGPTKSLVGTPAYMAPEQRAGLVVDARADQYSFCRALEEALFERGDTGAPTWLKPALQRGQRDDAAERWPDMDALLIALRRDPARRRRRALASAGVVALVGVATWGIARGGEREPTCSSGEEALVGAWDEDVRARVADAFARHGTEHASTTHDHVGAALDRYAESWVAMWRDACEATRMRGEESAELFDLRMKCLDRHRGQLAALTELLGEPTSDPIDRAPEAVDALAPVDDCGDAEALRVAVPLPSDATARTEVEADSAELDRLIAAYGLGRVREADVLARLGALVERASGLEYAPLEARAHWQLGIVQSAFRDAEAAEASLLAAVNASARARDDRMLANVLVELVRVVGAERRRFNEAPTLGRIAEATLVRARASDAERAKLHSHLGMVALMDRRFEDAKRELQRALELLADTPGTEGDRAVERANLAAVYHHLGDLAAAQAELEQSVAISEQVYGEKHPTVAAAVLNLAVVVDKRGEHERACELYERAIAIWEGAYGPEFPDIASGLTNLAIAETELGRLDAAGKHAARALEILRATEGSSPVRVGNAHSIAGRVACRRGEHEKGIAALEQALHIREEVIGKEDLALVDAITDLADCQLAAGQAAAAIALLERGLAIAGSDPKLGPQLREQLARAKSEM